MFTRRKSRNISDSSYTGVNQYAAPNNQPSNNALAAAYTIGQTFKQGNNGQAINYNYARNTNSYGGGMSKRNSLRNNSRQSLAIPRSTSTRSINNSLKPPSRTSQGYGQSSLYSKGSHDIDSFNESFGDQNNEAYYSNIQNMQDLKVSQKHFGKSNGGNSFNGETSQKMVKRYIPTVNGIKVIEVPESNFSQEIARTNSMRSGRSIGRSPSLNSFTKPRQKVINGFSSPRTTKEKTTSKRLDSLNSPKMGAVSEKDEILSEFDGISVQEKQRKYDEILKQVNHEKRLADELDKKTLEYEKLIKERVEKERSLAVLQEELKKSPKKQEGSVEKKDPTSNDESTLSPNFKHDFVGLNGQDDVSQIHENKEEEDVPVLESPPPAVDELDKVRLVHVRRSITSEDDQSSSSSVYMNDYKIPPPILQSQDDIEADDTIDPSSVVVDELDRKDIGNFGDDQEREQNINAAAQGDEAELGIIKQYGDLQSSESLTNEIRVSHDNLQQPLGDSSDNESPVPESYTEEDKSQDLKNDSLASHLRPKFDTVPEVIDEVSADESKDEDTYLKPSSSSQSVSTLDSDHQPSKVKSPPKSAMKKSNLSGTSPSDPSLANNPAQYAYLSLTTAENTRLNSKLSASQLGQPPQSGNGIPPSSPHFVFHVGQQQTPPPSQRMSQTLRKPPVQQQNQPVGMSSRTLRQSLDPYADPYSGWNGRGQRLGQNGSTFVSSTGHSSKAKAAELYAKANSRPYIKPLERKSSFDKEKPAEPKADTIKSGNHRITMRDPPPALPSQQNNIQNSEASHAGATEPASRTYSSNEQGFQSRFADSDNEDNFPIKAQENPLASENKDAPQNISLPQTNHSYVNSDKEPISLENSKNEGDKKKKFKKLRKIFGKN